MVLVYGFQICFKATINVIGKWRNKPKTSRRIQMAKRIYVWEDAIKKKKMTKPEIA